MLARLSYGEVPAKHHTALRDASGRLFYEECITRDGFEGPYTLVYHRDKPQSVKPGGKVAEPHKLTGELPTELKRRHFKSLDVKGTAGTPYAARVPLLFNADLTIGTAQPTAPDEAVISNGDGDELLYIFEGGGTVRSLLGDLPFETRDYVFLPRAVPYRIVPDAGKPQRWLTLEFKRGLGIPAQWRNPSGQLRMDAPYCHRDFRAPKFTGHGLGSQDESLKTLAVKKNDRTQVYESDHPLLDAVGWDGAVYPFVFPILNFQPRVGLTHLPPTWHGTFAGSGALVCSFVPRPVDFHPQAIPCPYPHSNVDVDEVLFYCSGNFTSRRGIAPGSISFHPAGVPHGPQGDAYEKSIGSKSTEELAVMLDCYKPLAPTPYALGVEDPKYPESFGG